MRRLLLGVLTPCAVPARVRTRGRLRRLEPVWATAGGRAAALLASDGQQADARTPTRGSAAARGTRDKLVGHSEVLARDYNSDVHSERHTHGYLETSREYLKICICIYLYIYTYLHRYEHRKIYPHVARTGLVYVYIFSIYARIYMITVREGGAGLSCDSAAPTPAATAHAHAHCSRARVCAGISLCVCVCACACVCVCDSARGAGTATIPGGRL
jgi:hypothetical protein